MSRLTLTIDGMSCGHCVAAVRSELARQPGVKVEHVAVGSATVSYDPSQCSPSAISQAVTQAGYQARDAA